MRLLSKILQSNKGFSLAEIMVAAGLLGVVSVGVMQLTTNTQKVQKNADQKEDTRDLTSEIRSLLRNSVTCLETVSPGAGAAVSATFGATANGSGNGTDVGSLINPVNQANRVPVHGIRIDTDDNFTGDTFRFCPVDNPCDAGGYVQANNATWRLYRKGRVLIQDMYLRASRNSLNGAAKAAIIVENNVLVSDWHNRTGVGVGVSTNTDIIPIELVIQYRKGTRNDAADAVGILGNVTTIEAIPIDVFVDPADNEVVGCRVADTQYVEAACTAFGGRIFGDRCVGIDISEDPLDAPAEIAVNVNGDLNIGPANKGGVSKGNLIVGNDITVGNNLTVTNNSDFQGQIANSTAALVIADDAQVTGFLTVGNNLTVANDATIGNNAKVEGDLDIRGTIFDGNSPSVTINDGLVVVNNSDFQGQIANSTGPLVIADDAQVTQNFSVAKDTSLAQELDVRGNIVNDTGDVTVADTMTVTGALTLTAAIPTGVSAGDTRAATTGWVLDMFTNQFTNAQKQAIVANILNTFLGEGRNSYQSVRTGVTDYLRVTQRLGTSDTTCAAGEVSTGLTFSAGTYQEVCTASPSLTRVTASNAAATGGFCVNGNCSTSWQVYELSCQGPSSSNFSNSEKPNFSVTCPAHHTLKAVGNRGGAICCRHKLGY